MNSGVSRLPAIICGNIHDSRYLPPSSVPLGSTDSMRRRILLLCVLILLICAYFMMDFSELYVPSISDANHTCETSSNCAMLTHESVDEKSSLLTADSASGVVGSRADVVIRAYTTPIQFWGKVIDQYGCPVPQANIRFSVADKFFGEGTKYRGVSDALGYFEFKNAKGASVSIAVSKDGYYAIPGKSKRSFGYGLPVGSMPPSKEKPFLFTLHKGGVSVPLLFTRGDSALPIDGSVVGFNIRKNILYEVPVDKADILLELVSNYGGIDSYGMYDWWFRITVPRGGIAMRHGDFDFIAPPDGYESSFYYTVRNGAESWKDEYRGNFFLLLHDGVFARIELLVRTWGGGAVGVDCYLNPVPQQRNLEADSSKLLYADPNGR